MELGCILWIRRLVGTDGYTPNDYWWSRHIAASNGILDGTSLESNEDHLKHRNARYIVFKVIQGIHNSLSPPVPQAGGPRGMK